MTNAPKNVTIPDLHQTVGSAISKWTMVEIQLYQIFAITLKLTVMQPRGGFSINWDVPNAILGAIDGFRGKLLMIDAALKTSLRGRDPECAAILNDWAVARDKVNKLHGNRSKLAHWTVMNCSVGRDEYRARLKPPVYSSTHHQGIQQTDIEGWEAEFKSAAIALSEISNRLASSRELQRRHVQQVASQIDCILPHDPTLLEYLKQELSDHL